MRKILFIIFCLLFGISLNSSWFTSSTSSTSSEPRTISLLFIQHTYLRDYNDDNGNIVGYYFRNDVKATTTFEYEEGYYLSSEEINDFGPFNLHHS